jgi:4-amino-4-deoxy-L-arabinose transferase-like glycosyltransferase
MRVGSSAAAPFLLALALFAGSLVLAASVPLVSPDEGRNAEVAREMVASGDWLVPRLAGMPYLDKPPALFWAEAAAIRLFGPTRVAVRLPAALAALGTLILIARRGRRSAGTAFARRAVALLGLAPLFAAMSAYVIFDMPLTLCVTVVWIGIVDELESGPSRSRRVAMFAAVTAGVLLKGPVMLAWAVLGSAGAALVLRSRAALSWLAFWPGWLLLLLVAGGWFACASARFPEYPHYAFLEESVERMATGRFHREQPAWFVPAVLIAGTLAWSLVTPWRRRLGREGRVALGFVVFAAVFFTLSRSKLVTYLLPALPPLAWLAAEAWTDAPSSRRAGVIAAIVYGALALALAISGGGVAAIRDPALGAATAGAARALTIGFAITTLLGAWAAWRRRNDLALIAAVAFTPLVFLLGGRALARHAKHESGESLARAIAAAGGGRVRYERCYSPGTDFVLGRGSTIVSPDGAETTSNHQLRYRNRLVERGLWTPRDRADDGDADVVVRSSRAGGPPPPRWAEFYRGPRFAAFMPATPRR